MQGSPLRHLAVVAGGALGAAGDPAEAIVAACRRAAAMAAEAFAAAPSLQVFSFVAPDIDRLLDDPSSAARAGQACVEAAAILRGAAGGVGAQLRLCGRDDGLPAALRREGDAHPTAAGRTILWFVRYHGREEIARAAARFFRAHPGKTLGDEDLDAWLDSAGTPDPDLILIGGGPFEAPDALVWQGSYAELWHTATPWSAFTPAELRRAITDFAARQRRFGG